LWLAWKRGERREVWPWLGLLLGFSVVLAGMYSFFYFTTSIDEDTVAQAVLTLVFVAFIFSLWRRISPRREFALAVVLLILAASGISFLLWLLAYRLSGWNWWAAIGGVAVLGVVGMLVGLTSLNALGRQTTDD
jgi:FtsH-binding integral membrane protein